MCFNSGEKQAPVGLCRPVNRPLTGGAFEKRTMYNTEFTPKEIICPAQVRTSDVIRCKMHDLDLCLFVVVLG